MKTGSGDADTSQSSGSVQQSTSSKSAALSIEGDAIFSVLKQLAIDNEAHFRQCPSSFYSTRVAECCHEISTSIDVAKDLVKQLQDVARKCDYDENTPGNGFRSLISVIEVVLLRMIAMLRGCAENRSAVMFRLLHYCKEIESFGAILRFLILAFQQVVSMLSMLEKDSLFPPLDSEYEQFNGVLKGIECLDASCFYGRQLGFHFSPSVQKIFYVIGIVLATYSLSWETSSAALGSLLHSGKLLLNPEQRAVRIIKVTREADIEFCRGFWNLSEIPVPKLFCPTMALCENREIPLSGPMPIETVDGSVVMIPEPSAHTGARPVKIKVLSASHRIGLTLQPNVSSNKLAPSSRLVMHCHGGGYVATSSKSHETYLRSWAKALNCPLVSIDYSLAPENPFPRPTEEVLYAYAWILNNPEKLGWTGEKVCMVGDSAGGNLIVSVNLRLVELNVKRLPDGLVPIYTPFLFQYLPSPSRVLSFMDPLLHMGVVIRCAAAYTGSYSDEELDKDCAFHDKSSGTSKAHKSLVEYVDEVQKAQQEHLLDFSYESQSIVSLINLSQRRAMNGTCIEDHSSNNSSPSPSIEKARGDGSSPSEKFNFEDDQDRDYSALNNEPSEPVSKESKKKLTRNKARTLSQSLADTAALAAGHAYDNISDWFDAPKTPIGFADKQKLTRAVTMSAISAAKVQQEEAEGHKSHFTELLKLKLPRDYLMSPLYAPDALLRKFPPIRFVACQMDPLLDDTIMFAKKMRKAGGRVASVHLLNNLPHGFLNFAPMSSDCSDGANLCLERIKETFKAAK